VRVEVVELGRAIAADATGTFVFRNLPAGQYTLEARASGHASRRVVLVPPEPSAIRGVELELGKQL
jgi:hypothetical protein